MGAPATQGRLCTRLEEMEIGDYIRCTYTATEANVAGEFSDLGGFVDSYETEQQQVDAEGNAVVNAAGKPVMEKVMKRYEELPTTPAAIGQGYFYFLKVDKGLCVADRRVQSNIAWSKINEKEYIQGHLNAYGLLRVLSPNEYQKYITKSDCNGNIIPASFQVWNVIEGNIYINHEIFNHDTSTKDVTLLFEVTGKSTKDTYTPEYNLNGKKYDELNYIRGRAYINWNYEGARGKDVSVYLNASDFNSGMTNKIFTVTSTHPHASVRAILKLNAVICFRPAIEYIDNPNSKTIYF